MTASPCGSGRDRRDAWIRGRLSDMQHDRIDNTQNDTKRRGGRHIRTRRSATELDILLQKRQKGAEKARREQTMTLDT